MNEKLLAIAIAEYGTKEIPGPESNPKILKYFADSGNSWAQDDDTAWCSVFVAWCVLQAGLKKIGTALARSWLKIGIPVENPKAGDVVIFWRIDPYGPYGHCGLYIADAGEYIYVLGGNQSNMVNIILMPKNKVLGYRHLTD